MICLLTIPSRLFMLAPFTSRPSELLEEMKELKKKIQDQKEQKKSIGSVFGDVVGGAFDLLKGTHSVFDLLDTQAETFVFDDPSHYKALVESLKQHDVSVIEK